MKNTCNPIIRRFILVIALGFGLGFISPAYADNYLIDTNDRTWTNLDLAVHQIRNVDTRIISDVTATDINNAGQVTGWFRSGLPFIFITGPNGVGAMVVENPTYARAAAINNTGQVAGTSRFQGAFLTGPNGAGMKPVGLGPLSGASSINDSGQVVGSGYSQGERAFITGPNGTGITDLGEGGATAINNAGQVVGADTADKTPGGPGHAFYNRA